MKNKDGLERIFYYGGKAKDLIPAVEEAVKAEADLMFEESQMRHREEAEVDPE